VASALPAPTVGAALRFPAGFAWGTATAAVQVEGGTTNSDWADFEQRPGAIRDGQRIGQAARHYELYDRDFAQAAAMHTNAYRFSIEWSRLEPRKGAWDRAAEAHYRAVLKSLRAHGLRPMVTLHHFSNPRWVAAQGGWANPATIADFEGFVRRAAVAFGDQVDDWITFNEPTIYASEGYFSGRFPPGISDDLNTLPRVLGHLAQAHWRAYRALHQLDKVARVGVAEHMMAFSPASSWNPLDGLWAGITEGWMNYGFLDAAHTGRARFDTFAARFWRDEPAFAGSLDFVGVNYYTRWLVSCWQPLDRRCPEGAAVSDLGLEIYPEGMAAVLERTYARYRLPVVVTETGIADAQRRTTPGFMVRYLAQVHRAIAHGVPVQGVYWWSLIDNFEWQNGYHGRFGLLAVDFADPARKRTWTPAARIYARIAGRNAITADLLAKYEQPPAEAVTIGEGATD
jgi:beta-glucosidase